MDGPTFAHQLSAWLDPWRIVRAAIEDEPGDTVAIATLRANQFHRASEVSLDLLAQLFLDHFELNVQLLSAVLGASQIEVPAESRGRLSGLRFTGKMWSDDFDTGSRENTVLALRGRPLELQVVAGPLYFLTTVVDQIAALWSPLDRSRAFFEPSMHTELLVYIESAVAKALGFIVDAASTTGKQGQNLRFGGVVTMVGGPPYGRQRYLDSIAKLTGVPVSVARPAAELASAASHLSDADGFISLEPLEAAKAWMNIDHFRNECSPYSRVEAPPPLGDGRLLVDTHYGRAFDFTLADGSAVYGHTNDLTVRRRSDVFGYLRVPYRAVPRIRVRSRAQLESIAQEIQSLLRRSLVPVNLLFRGQVREYLLKRSPEALSVLYGDDTALEPSLPTSASRKGMSLERVLPEWCLLTRAYVVALNARAQTELDPVKAAKIAQLVSHDIQRFGISLDNHAFALSLAQHYGLPSMGLDLTDDLGTALYFALRAMKVVGDRRLQAMPNESPEPVLYAFGLPERFCVEHARARPGFFPRGRPDVQNAWFSHMGWGFRRNHCAEYLVAALYLDPDGDFGDLPETDHLFPDSQNDMFGSFLEVVLAQSWASSELRRFLGSLYWLER